MKRSEIVKFDVDDNKVKIINRCGGGYCSKNLNSLSCHAHRPPNWNGKCSYQSGNPVTAGNHNPGCCERGCTMSATEYAQWNGLCAFQK